MIAQGGHISFGMIIGCRRRRSSRIRQESTNPTGTTDCGYIRTGASHRSCSCRVHGRAKAPSRRVRVHPATRNGVVSLVGLFLARSWAFWRLSQNSGVVSSALASNHAVWEVTPRFPRISSLMRWTGTPRCAAKATWLTPSGFRNSSSRILPGWVGIRFLGIMYSTFRGSPRRALRAHRRRTSETQFANGR